MRWLIGVLVDLAVGGIIALIVLIVDPSNLRLALAEGIIGCLLLAALLGLYVCLRPKVVVLRTTEYRDLLSRLKSVARQVESATVPVATRPTEPPLRIRLTNPQNRSAAWFMDYFGLMVTNDTPDDIYATVSIRLRGTGPAVPMLWDSSHRRDVQIPGRGHTQTFPLVVRSRLETGADGNAFDLPSGGQVPFEQGVCYVTDEQFLAHAVTTQRITDSETYIAVDVEWGKTERVTGEFRLFLWDDVRKPMILVPAV